MMITWIKPNGAEIVTNDHGGNISIAESNGWKRKGAGEEKPAKRGRPKKAAAKKPE